MKLPFFNAELAEVGFEPTMLAWGPVFYEDGGQGVLMDGLVVATDADAERAANLLENRLGFFAINYGDDAWMPSRPG